MAARTIRPARLTDEAFLFDLTSRLGEFDVPAWRTPAEIARADDEILRAALHEPSEHARILVAEDGGERVGYVFVSTRVDYFTHERHAHVEVLAVAPGHDRQGIGRELLAAAEAWAAARGDRFITLTVWSQNARARAVYDHLGWAPETIRYRKPLADS